MTISVISSILLCNYDTIEVNDFIELAINSTYKLNGYFLHDRMAGMAPGMALMSIETAASIFLTGNRPYGALGCLYLN